MHVFLETEHLVLRRFTEDDVDELVELDGDPEVMRYVTGGRPTSREEIETEVLPAFLGYYERYAGFGFWAVVEKSSGEVLGWFHFRPENADRPDEVELGYRLRRSAWGKGYATEGSRALVAKGVRRTQGEARLRDNDGRERRLAARHGEGRTEVRPHVPPALAIPDRG